MRKELGWPDDSPLVLYAGRMGYVNGVSYLAKLAAYVYEKDKNIKFLVIGEGKEENEIQRVAREGGVLNRNFFMLPKVPKSQIHKYYSAATIATALSFNEKGNYKGYMAEANNKFFDSLASSTPLAINFDWGYAANLIKEKEIGIILDGFDLEKATDDLISHIYNEEWLKKASRNCKKLAIEKFSREKLVDVLEDILRRNAKPAN